MTLASRILWSAIIAMLFGFIAMLMALLVPAHGQELAPRVGEDMTPNISSFYSSLHNMKGEWCCTSADTRKTKVRVRDGEYEAWIDEHFPDVGEGQKYPAGWYPIPAWAQVPKTPNLVGETVVSFYGGHVHCFLDVAGT